MRQSIEKESKSSKSERLCATEVEKKGSVGNKNNREEKSRGCIKKFICKRIPEKLERKKNSIV